MTPRKAPKRTWASNWKWGGPGAALAVTDGTGRIAQVPGVIVKSPVGNFPLKCGPGGLSSVTIRPIHIFSRGGVDCYSRGKKAVTVTNRIIYRG